jgi:predicted membrane protein
LGNGYRESKSNNIRKQQILFLFLGSLIGFSAGSLNFLLDFNIIIPPYYNFLVPFYLLFAGYAIVKHHLFDIKLILTELLVSIFSTFLFIQIFLSNSFWQYLWNITIFIVFLFFGYLFIKSILKEIRIKQKIGEASWKVLEQGEVVSENFKKVMGDKEKLLKDWFLSDVNKELEMNSLRNRVKELEEKYEKKE